MFRHSLKLSAAIALATGLSLFSIQPASAQNYDACSRVNYEAGINPAYQSAVPPPAIPVEQQAAAPGEGYLWTPGYWTWDPDNCNYQWVSGQWLMPPTMDMLWTPGYWEQEGGNFWIWHTGYWGQSVGYYGGINYGFGYPGIGYFGGYWAGNWFYYNLEFNRFHHWHPRHTYRRTAPHFSNTNRDGYVHGNPQHWNRHEQFHSDIHQRGVPHTEIQARTTEPSLAQPPAFNHGIQDRNSTQQNRPALRQNDWNHGQHIQVPVQSFREQAPVMVRPEFHSTVPQQRVMVPAQHYSAPHVSSGSGHPVPSEVRHH